MGSRPASTLDPHFNTRPADALVLLVCPAAPAVGPRPRALEVRLNPAQAAHTLPTHCRVAWAAGQQGSMWIHDLRRPTTSPRANDAIVDGLAELSGSVWTP